jgi:SAM-dependent methyltransferase
MVAVVDQLTGCMMLACVKDSPMPTDWNTIYTRRPADQLGWYESVPALSLRMITDSAITYTAPLIDVGAGAALLIDQLLAAGYRDLTALDCASAALEVSRQRLGAAADAVTWITADILQADLPAQHYALWHDRAVFHFLTEPADQLRYLAVAAAALQPGGYLLLATFAPDGPTHCSERPVQRWSSDGLAHLTEEYFTLVNTILYSHLTPSGSTQQFAYTLLQRR